MGIRKRMTPVSVWGIEFDALIEETKNMSATIPVYPVEEGFPVSDTIINDPISISMTLYLSNTPVTWLHRHGTSRDRVKRICSRIENKWMERELTKIVTANAVYTNMGITSLSIKHTAETGYAREIAIEAQKVYVTQKKTVSIPADILQGGATGASGGSASTSGTSATSEAQNAGNVGGGSGNGSGNGSGSESKKAQSILYGVASGLGFV